MVCFFWRSGQKQKKSRIFIWGKFSRFLNGFVLNNFRMPRKIVPILLIGNYLEKVDWKLWANQSSANMINQFYEPFSRFECHYHHYIFLKKGNGEKERETIEGYISSSEEQIEWRRSKRKWFRWLKTCKENLNLLFSNGILVLTLW